LNRISFHEPIKKTAGFTLIELLIVIVIVAIMSAVVGSNIGSGNQSTVLNGAAREVASALRYARGHAMTHRKESAFQFDLEQNSYRVTGKSKEYKVSKDIEVTLELAQSQVQDDSQGAIRFFPDGSSTGGRVTLEIAESKRQLDVNWLTGQVEISEF
jgi:general secretion pathway protein H